MKHINLSFSMSAKVLAAGCMGFAALLASPCANAEALQVTDEITQLVSLDDKQATISGKGELHLTSKTPFANGSTVELASVDAMLVLRDVLPSEAISAELYKNVTIDGRQFDPEKDRLAIYGTGCAFMASGYEDPLTIFTEENFGGNSMKCQYDMFYTAKGSVKTIKYLTAESLDDFDNNIRSFKLKRGFMVCFANNPDGTGFSRCFIADDADLEIPAMPEGLEFASFIRVSRHDWYAKRGICNGGIKDITRSTWYYDWGGSNVSTVDSEFIPMKHDMSWDSYDKIGGRTNTSAVLSFNEPDHKDQAHLSVSEAIQQHTNFFKFGLRIGSPAPDNVNSTWLKEFMACADSLNYRVDFVAAHMYWNSQDPQTLVNNIEKYCKSNFGHRPMWITEWNNGANWTNEAWPDNGKGKALDANFKPLLDANGKEYETTRPHTAANSAKQCEWLPRMLQAFEDNPWIERHAFYNWVQDARNVVINRRVDRKKDENGKDVVNDKGEVQWNTVDELTPAGKLFIEKPSKPGYDKSVAYVTTWKIAPPYPKIQRVSNGVRLSFYDHNGETGVKYIIERKVLNGKWEYLDEVLVNEDYRPGKTVSYTDTHITKKGRHQYRVKALSYKGKESIYSRVMTTTVENVPDAVDEIGEGNVVDIHVENGTLVLDGFNPGQYDIYGVDGKLVRTVSVDGLTRVEDLARGVYIISGIKVRI